ncbi:MAG: hypothetical protein IMZ53_14945 [Thermoplasmata archaeon]|nr:hypothetical protein [Thermoplasmata archaeon]
MILDYIVRCKCEKIVAWISGDAAGRKESRKIISNCLKDGLSIERMSTEDAKIIGFCKNHGKCK